MTPAVCKASAGAVEHLPIAIVRNITDFLTAAKQAGLWCYGADADAPLLGRASMDLATFDVSDIDPAVAQPGHPPVRARQRDQPHLRRRQIHLNRLPRAIGFDRIAGRRRVAWRRPGRPVA